MFSTIETAANKYFYRIILTLAAIFFLYFLCFKIFNYYNFRNYWDAIYYIKTFITILQPSKSLAAGGINTVFLSGYGGCHFFFDHLYFTSLLILPFYYLISSSFTIDILHIIAVISGGLFIAAISRKLLNSALCGAVIFIIFNIHPTVQGSVIITFNSTSLSLLFAAALLYAFVNKHKKMYFIAAMLFMATREDLAFIIILFNLAVIIKDRVLKPYSYITIIAFIYLVIGLFWILPRLSASNHGHLQLMNYYS